MIGQTALVAGIITFKNYFQLMVIPIITIILAIRLIKQKKETGKLNYIRFYIFLAFITFSWLVVWQFIYEEANINNFLTDELYGRYTTTFSIYNLGLVFMGTLALSLVLYANQIESLYYMPFFILGGMVILYLFTGYADWLMIYVYISCSVGLVFLYLTAFKLRDNGSLGLSIFFSLAFVTVFAQYIPIENFGPYVAISYCVFGLIFALGYFHPFNTKEVDINA